MTSQNDPRQRNSSKTSDEAAPKSGEENGKQWRGGTTEDRIERKKWVLANEKLPICDYWKAAHDHVYKPKKGKRRRFSWLRFLHAHSSFGDVLTDARAAIDRINSLLQAWAKGGGIDDPWKLLVGSNKIDAMEDCVEKWEKIDHRINDGPLERMYVAARQYRLQLPTQLGGPIDESNPTQDYGCLVTLAAYLQILAGNGNIRLPSDDIALMMGCIPRTISRWCKQMRRDGIVILRDRNRPYQYRCDISLFPQLQGRALPGTMVDFVKLAPTDELYRKPFEKRAVFLEINGFVPAGEPTPLVAIIDKDAQRVIGVETLQSPAAPTLARPAPPSPVPPPERTDAAKHEGANGHAPHPQIPARADGVTPGEKEQLPEVDSWDWMVNYAYEKAPVDLQTNRLSFKIKLHQSLPQQWEKLTRDEQLDVFEKVRAGTYWHPPCNAQPCESPAELPGVSVVDPAVAVVEAAAPAPTIATEQLPEDATWDWMVEYASKKAPPEMKLTPVEIKTQVNLTLRKGWETKIKSLKGLTRDEQVAKFEEIRDGQFPWRAGKASRSASTTPSVNSPAA